MWAVWQGDPYDHVLIGVTDKVNAERWVEALRTMNDGVEDAWTSDVAVLDGEPVVRRWWNLSFYDSDESSELDIGWWDSVDEINPRGHGFDQEGPASPWSIYVCDDSREKVIEIARRLFVENGKVVPENLR